MARKPIPDSFKKLIKDVECIDIHGNQVRVAFSLKGERLREPLDIKNYDKNDVKFAIIKRDTIHLEIKEERFDYLAHFPKSKNALKFIGVDKSAASRTVHEGVKAWLNLKKVKVAKATYVNYELKAQKLLAYWPETVKISDIPKTDIEAFQVHLLTQGGRHGQPLSPKSTNDTFTIVRGVWRDAFADSVFGTRTNPLEYIENIDTGDAKDDSDADPFTIEELNRIASTPTHRTQEVNAVLFACWTGLSSSELIALSWEDIDRTNWIAGIRRALVLDSYKVPKEKSRNREVELLDPAIELLKKQMEHTFMLPAVKVIVTNRDNLTTRTETIRPVFYNSKSGKPFPNVKNLRENFFQGHLRKAGIRYRGVNQCRHTYASRLLSNYIPQEYIARQMGHTDTKMLHKHYAKWIPKESPKMASWVSEKLGVQSDEPVNQTTTKSESRE